LHTISFNYRFCIFLALNILITEVVILKAIVQRIIRNGNHGSYVVATSEEVSGSVTFSLEPTVWQEEESPEEGMIVFLNKLRMKRAGWRAKEARFWKPCDEQKEH
jgi:hypothetical protein